MVKLLEPLYRCRLRQKCSHVYHRKATQHEGSLPRNISCCRCLSVRHASDPEGKGTDSLYTESFFTVFKVKGHTSRSECTH